MKRMHTTLPRRELHRSARVVLAAWVMASTTGAADATAVPPESRVTSGATPAQAPVRTPQRLQTRRPRNVDCRDGCLYSNGTWMLTPPDAPSAAASASGGR